jgi:hypothetical protein
MTSLVPAILMFVMLQSPSSVEQPSSEVIAQAQTILASIVAKDSPRSRSSSPAT